MKILNVIGQIVMIFVVVALMWVVAGFAMAMIVLGCGIAAICLLGLHDVLRKDKKFELIETRNATLYQGNTGAICLDNKSKMYELGCQVNELTLNYQKRNISKKAYGSSSMTVEEVIQIVEEGETPHIEIYEWRRDGIFTKKVYKRYNIIIPISSVENY